MELDERYNTFDGSVHTNMKGNGENSTMWVGERLIIEVATGFPRTATRRSTVPARTATRRLANTGTEMQGFRGSLHRMTEAPEHRRLPWTNRAVGCLYHDLP